MMQVRCGCRCASMFHISSSHLRFFRTTPVVQDIKFRLRNKLPVNHNASGILTDGPDFTYLDSSKPATLNRGQAERIFKQQKLAETVLKLNKEIQFALNKEREIKLEEQLSRRKILDSKLKPKGNSVHNKSNS